MNTALGRSRIVRCAVALAAGGCGLAVASGCVINRGSPFDRSDTDDGGVTLFPFGGDDGGGGPIGPTTGIALGCGPSLPLPSFGNVVTAATPPPPISGGTLLVTRDGTCAVAADPDRDAVYVVDLPSRTLKFTIALSPGDEPGRLAEDGEGRIHVALRGSGTLATLDRTAGTVTARRPVCPAPRGVAWQASSDVVWVACATGELASLPAAGGAASVQHIDRDLRDVILDGDALAVTQFRTSHVLHLASDESLARTDTMGATASGEAPQVVWRAVGGPNGEVVAVHQLESTDSLSTTSAGGYGCGGAGGLSLPTPPPTLGDGGALEGLPSLPPLLLGAGGAVSSALTILDANGTAIVNTIFQGVLPVDVAISADGSTVAAVAAGSGAADVDNVFVFDEAGSGGGPVTSFAVGAGAQATAVAFDAQGELLVQTREPAALWLQSAVQSASMATVTGDAQAATDATDATDAAGVSIPLSPVSRYDTGHDIFHTHAGSPIACASCHPEGGDDGHVWILDGNQRRTPSLRGTIEGTAPYHWPGDEASFTSIVKDVYEVRMSGGALSGDQVGALSAWVNAIPAPPAPSWVDASAAAAGRVLFERSDVGCAGCHSGAKFTNNATMNVGTGGNFQVPPLVGVGWRTPLLHDGCAATIADRFGACATNGHGNLASLTTGDIANLTAYLETL
jgi:hypothetical protein